MRILRVVRSLPTDRTAATMGNQLLRCGMSVGANCRAACRARSPADFRAKLGIVEEECDETMFWLEAIGEDEAIAIPPERFADLIAEANEILAIVIASIKTSKRQSQQ